jgi:hypothetical protein
VTSSAATQGEGSSIRGGAQSVIGREMPLTSIHSALWRESSGSTDRPVGSPKRSTVPCWLAMFWRTTTPPDAIFAASSDARVAGCAASETRLNPCSRTRASMSRAFARTSG